MKTKSKDNEMNTNYYSVLLGIFLAITALILYKNVTSPVVKEEHSADFGKQEENAVINEEETQKQSSPGSVEKTH